MQHIPLNLTLAGVRVTTLAVVLSMLGACAATNDQDRTRREGAAVGALLGAIAGNAASGNNRTQGTALGAVLGGLIGAAAGDRVAARKAAYIKREEDLRLAAAQAEQLTAQTRDYNEQVRQDIAQLEQAQSRLQNEVLTAEARQQLSAEHRERTIALLQQIEKALTEVRGAIAVQQAAIRTEQQQPTPSDNIRLVSAGVQELQGQESELERARAQLQLIDRRRAY